MRHHGGGVDVVSVAASAAAALENRYEAFLGKLLPGSDHRSSRQPRLLAEGFVAWKAGSGLAIVVIGQDHQDELR